MICKKIGANAQTSEYCATLKGKKLLNYGMALSELLGTGKDLPTTQAELEDAFQKAAAAASAEDEDGANEGVPAAELWPTRPPAVMGLSREAVKELGHFIRCVHLPTGPEWFARAPSPGMVFTQAETPYLALMQGAGEEDDDGHSTPLDPEDSAVEEVACLIRKLHLTSRLWEYRVIDPETGRFSAVLSQPEYVKRILEGSQMPVAPSAAEQLLSTTVAQGIIDKDPVMASIVAQHLDVSPSMRLGHIASPASTLTQALAKEKGVRLRGFPATLTNNPNRPAYTYVDLAKFTPGPTPAFDNWILRIASECRELFMALLYAPLVASCAHRKACWIRSEGYDGKSTFFSALDTYLGGRMTQPISTSSLTSEFGLASTIGKRILILGDCQNPGLLGTNAAHWITGGDKVVINRKNLPMVNYRYRAMLFVGANCTPEVSLHQNNSTTRLAYIPMEKPTAEQLKRYCLVDSKGEVMRQSDGTPLYKGSNFEKELIQEMPHILHKCRVFYERLCPTGKEMIIPPKAYNRMLEDCGSQAGDVLDAYCGKYLEFGDTFTVGTEELLTHFCRVRKITQRDHVVGELRRYLEKQGAVCRRNHRSGRVWYGVGIKEE